LENYKSEGAKEYCQRISIWWSSKLVILALENDYTTALFMDKFYHYI
jgi:hypothetical protein